MLAYFLNAPSIYYLTGFIILVSLIVYWKRGPIKNELRRWRAKEAKAGPVTFERKGDKLQEKTSTPTAGVHFGKGSDFAGAKVKSIAGRDIRNQSEKTPKTDGEPTSGVDFGEEGKFKNAEIEDIAGRDLEK